VGISERYRFFAASFVLATGGARVVAFADPHGTWLE
jgi:hypothetical protein